MLFGEECGCSFCPQHNSSKMWASTMGSTCVKTQPSALWPRERGPGRENLQPGAVANRKATPGRNARAQYEPRQAGGGPAGRLGGPGGLGVAFFHRMLWALREGPVTLATPPPEDRLPSGGRTLQGKSTGGPGNPLIRIRGPQRWNPGHPGLPSTRLRGRPRMGAHSAGRWPLCCPLYRDMPHQPPPKETGSPFRPTEVGAPHT